VTGTAVIGGEPMVCRFAGKLCIVVTGNTCAHNLTVIHAARRDRRPGCRARLVAGIAQRGRSDMVIRLRMTTGTGTNNFVMVHAYRSYRRPACRERLVAGVTHIATGNMRRMFATCGDAIVTVDAIPNERRMVRCTAATTRGGYPGVGVVAGITRLSGGNV
jgi:hypothetical protein